MDVIYTVMLLKCTPRGDMWNQGFSHRLIFPAFDPVAHTYAQAFFLRMGIPSGQPQVLLFLFQAPARLILPAAYAWDRIPTPPSRVQQGGPLSSALLSLVISPIIQHLHQAVRQVHVLLYAGDIMLVFACARDKAIRKINQCMPVYRQFSYYAGLAANVDQTFPIPKGDSYGRVENWTVRGGGGAYEPSEPWGGGGQKGGSSVR